MHGDLIRVTTSYAVYGLLVHDGWVIDAAPICHWAVGKRERYVADYLRTRRGATFERL
jgi:hypothetical protein